MNGIIGMTELALGTELNAEQREFLRMVKYSGDSLLTIINDILDFSKIEAGKMELDPIDFRLDTHLGDIMNHQDISEEEVIRAAKMVNAHSFIEKLPNGYQSIVRERGSNFSVGQKQLLSLARALAMDPDVLLLDEATANIDSESEALIQAALEVVLKGRTAIVIAHRLSTIQHGY